MLRSRTAGSLALLLLPVLGGCSSSPVTSAPWAASFADDDHVVDATPAVDGAGAVVLAGLFTGDLDVGASALAGGVGSDVGIFVTLLDPSGHPSWAKAIADGGAQGITAAGFDPAGDVLVAGGFSQSVDVGAGPFVAAAALSDDVFVAKLARDGHPVWARHFSGPDYDPPGNNGATPLAFAVDGAGNLALGGVFTGSFSFGGPPIFAGVGFNSTGFVVKLDNDGGHVFSMPLGGAGNSVNALAFDGAGDLLLGGVDNGSISVGGGSFSSFASNGFVAKLGAEGVPVWAFQLGGYSDVQCVAVDGAGNVLVGGWFGGELVAGPLHAQSSGGQDGFVLAVQPDGQPAWVKTFANAQIAGLAAGDAGEALVTGAYQGIADFGGGALPDASYTGGAFVTKLDATGRHVATKTFAAPTPEGQVPDPSAGTGVGMAGGDAVVTGSFAGALRIGDAALQSSGSGDLFVARLPL